MKCQKCPNQTQVIESRTNVNNTRIRRRRSCLCGHRFSTYEYSNETELQAELAVAKSYIYTLTKEVESVKLKMMNTKKQPLENISGWKV